MREKMKTGNLFADTPTALEEELIETISETVWLALHFPGEKAIM